MVSLGWSTTLQDDVFTLFELSCCNANSGPVVTKSIQVSEDFTWTISYKGHSVPRQSQLLHDTPSIVNTGKPSVFNLLYSIFVHYSAKAFRFNQLHQQCLYL